MSDIPGVDERRRDFVLRLIGIAAGIMAILCTFENNSKIGRVIATGAVLVLTGYACWRRWLPVDHLRRVALPLAAVFGAILVSTAFSIDPAFSARNLFEQHLWFLPLFAAMAVWASNPRHQLALLRGFMAAGLVSALGGIIMFYFARKLDDLGYIENDSDFVYSARDEMGRYYFRAQGFLNSYTRSGMVFVMTVPATIAVCLYAIRRRHRAELAIAAATLLLSVWYVLLTNTRAPWLAVATSAVLAFVFLRGKPWMLLAGAAFTLAVAAAIPAVRNRAATIIEHASNPNLLLSGRIDLWKQGIRPISENLWTGVGYGGNIFLTDAGIESYELISANTRQPDLHMIYLQTLAEVGVIGSLAYLWLVATVLWLGIRLVINSRRGGHDAPGPPVALAALASFLLFGLVFYYNEEHVAQLLWTMCGLLAIAPPAQSAEESAKGERFRSPSEA